MLAGDLTPRLATRGHRVVAPAESDFDITDAESVERAVSDANPELLVNCAAYNAVDLAETEPASADAVNGYGVRNLCVACRERKIPIVHFSTDYVFDGTKNSPYAVTAPPRPINRYGQSKLLGERFVQELTDSFYLVRTSWLFGLHGRNFVEVILAKAQEQGELAVTDGETGCPTWTGHVSDAVVDLIETRRFGVYHAVNSEPTTWHDFAAEILRLSGVDAVLHRVSSPAVARAARRPSFSVLDSHPLPEVVGWEMPSWSSALREYLRLRGRASD
jgi:dTDP-4-dehydrorhamnose reductase